ncbi:MAG: hypothetical protein LBU10_01265 [Endomicrobium sp.]|jgi:hypothetical protein|nr:hypothetical protein [Endomicrobium sp.]
MKKIVMATITSMTILANVSANDIKPIETLKSKNEVCILIDKPILRSICYQDKNGKCSKTDESGEWITDFRVGTDYYNYIDKNNRLGLGLGINVNPFCEFYNIYGVTKFKLPLTNRWFLGVGVGLGNVNTKKGVRTYRHEFFKLFTSFDFKNISIYLSYTQNILYDLYEEDELYERLDFTERFEVLNLGICKRFII